MQKRLRLFAGPNGSGKSTLKPLVERELTKAGAGLGRYINPDELAKDLRQKGFIDFEHIGVPYVSKAEIEQAARLHVQAERAGFATQFISEQAGRIYVEAPLCNDYFTSFLSDLFRLRLVQAGQDISFESVMSGPDKIGFLKIAQASGYKNYLYFICTDNAGINALRVEERVLQGGHDVPLDKIRERYDRVLNLLPLATLVCYRTYFFDNSEAGKTPTLIAEITPDWELVTHLGQDAVPSGWFLRVLPKLSL